MNRHFLITFFTCALLLASGNGTAGAPAPSADIEAWVEVPREGSILPMGPVPLIVYASASGGISYVHIQINGQSLPALPVAPQTVDGSARLVRVDYSWTPPGEGEYRVQAAGVNAAGASGGSGSTRFCIVTCNPANPPASLDTPTPAPAETGTPTPASGDVPTATPAFITLPTITPTVPGIFSVQFYADPSTINAGNCSTIRWDVTAAETVSVYFFGNLVGMSGNYQTCPCAEETHSLRVVKTDGSLQDYYATVYVSGSCYVPPPTSIPPTYAPPSDTSGPTFGYVEMRWAQEGCALYGWAGISDPAGVSEAVLWVNFNNSGWVYSYPMSQSGNNWYSNSGLDTLGAPGTVQYQVRAVDNYGNESWSGVSSKNFSYCGD